MSPMIPPTASGQCRLLWVPCTANADHDGGESRRDPGPAGRVHPPRRCLASAVPPAPHGGPALGRPVAGGTARIGAAGPPWIRVVAAPGGPHPHGPAAPAPRRRGASAPRLDRKSVV